MHTLSPEQILTEWQRRFPARLPNHADLEYLTPAQAARLLHRKPWPVVDAIRRGELPAFRPDDRGPWLIRPADLRAYVEGAAA